MCKLFSRYLFFLLIIFTNPNIFGLVSASQTPGELPLEELHRSSRRTDMVISEIMYRPGVWAGADNLEFVELFNSAPYPTDLSGYRLEGHIDFTFPEGTIVEARSFIVAAAAPAALEARYAGLTEVYGPWTGTLDRDEGEIRLVHPNGGVFLEAEYRALFPWPAEPAGGGHSLVLARPSYGQEELSAWEPSVLKGGSPGDFEPAAPDDPLNAIKINEFLAHTDDPNVDFIELYNHSGQTVDLSGVWLSDTPDANLFQIPAGTEIAPGGFIVFDQTELGFALAAAGEGIYLVTQDNTRVIDAIAFDAQFGGISMGRYPDGASEFTLLDEQTPGASNTGVDLYASPVIINEVMFNPITNDSDDTYVELYNRSDAAVDLSDWRFVDGISFVIPDGTILPAGGYLVIAENAEHLITRYTQLDSGNTLGNFGGRLANSGERLALAMPSYRTGLPTDYVVVDELSYRDGGRWGENHDRAGGGLDLLDPRANNRGQWANRNGSSLELRDPRVYNRRAANWTHSDETDKSEWVLIEHTGVMDHGMERYDCDHLHVLLPSAGQVLLDDVEVSVNGGPNLVQNSEFTSGMNGWEGQGHHEHTRWYPNDGYQDGQSLLVEASGGGDTSVNRVRVPLTQTLLPGTVVTLKARARWLAGHRQILLRLRDNYLEAVGNLHIPLDLGTPGQPNSALVSNTGPAIYEVRHSPALPAAGESVKVTARVHDPDGVSVMALHYRLDPSESYTAVTMRDDGTGEDAVSGDGLYTATIPGQSDGTLVAYYIEAEDGHLTPETTTFPEGLGGETDYLHQYEALIRFGDQQIAGDLTTYNMWFTQAVMNEWDSRKKMSNRRLPGTLVYGNRVIHNIGIRFRASPFRRLRDSAGYSGYSYHTPRDDRLFGAREFNLNKILMDNAAQREAIAYWIIGKMGLSFSHQAYIHVRLNGEEDGHVYTDIHHVDSDYLRTWFYDRDEGDFYKIDDWFEFNDDVTDFDNVNARLEVYESGGEKKKARYRWNWNKRSNRWLDDDYSSLFDLVDAVNAPGTDTYTQAVESTVDIEEWMRIFAARRLISDWDGYGFRRGKNAWAYKPEDDKFYLILWDIDMGVGANGSSTTQDLFSSTDDPVVRRMYAHPPFRRAYMRAFREAVNGPLNTPSSGMNQRLDDIYSALSANNISVNNPGSIKDWLADRRSYVLSEIDSEDAPWQPDQTGTMTTDDPVLTLTGTAQFLVQTITVNGIHYPVEWIDKNTWQINLLLEEEENQLEIRGLDRHGEVLESSSLSVTFTGVTQNAEDYLAINEIMCYPAVPETEFVEIHNYSDTHAFDLAGYRLRGVDFNFAPGTLIEPGGFLLVVRNRIAFDEQYGTGLSVAGEYSGTLQPDGEQLQLVRLATATEPELIIEEVNYSTSHPWPEGAAGTGASLQRIDPTQASDHPGNWEVETPLDPNADPTWQFVSLTARTHPSNPSDQIFIYLESPGEVHVDDLFLAEGGVAEIGTNLVQNGGFESLDNWTISDSHADSSLDTGTKHSGGSSLHVVASGDGGVNRAPVAADDSDETTIDIAVTINVLGNDYDLDADPITVDSVTQGGNGSVTNNGSDLTYTPDAGFTGTDSFEYTISDVNGANDNAIVTVSVGSVVSTNSGIEYEVFEGSWSSLPDFDSLSPVETGVMDVIDITAGRDGTDYFGMRWTGYIEVPSDATYTFYTASDDGSQLFIGETRVVDNDGAHAVEERSGSIGLQAGLHPLTVTFFEAGGGEQIDVFIEGGGMSKQEIPAANLFRIQNNQPPAASNDTASTGEDMAVIINVLANDSDPDSDPLAVDSVVIQGSNGTVTNNGSDVTYTPDTGFIGTDSFVYTVTDGKGGYDTATVTVTVTEISGGLISNLSVATGKDYEIDTYLAVGDLSFIDRSMEYYDVGSLAGNEYIRTANDDKNAVNANFLSFDISQDATVYVVYDNRNMQPSWLDSWTDTGEDIMGEGWPDGASVYARVFAAGTVTLGGNENGGSMYSVAAAPEDGTTSSGSIWQGGLDYKYDQEYTLSYWYLPNPNNSTLTVRLRYSDIMADGLKSTHSVQPGDEEDALVTPGATNSSKADLPPFPAVWLNEIQPRNDGAITDSYGEADQWVEIYYTGTEPLSLDGYSLSNDPDQPYLWSFPADAVLEPDTYTVVWLDGQPEQATAEEWHSDFTIDQASGTLYLFRHVGQTDNLVDWLDYEAVPWGLSYGRFPDGALEATQVFFVPSPGQVNDGLSLPLIHYWYFDDQLANDTPFEVLNASYSLVDTAYIEYHSALAGYPFDPTHENWRKASMERRNEPTELNYRSAGNQGLPYDDNAMRGVQISQPFTGDGGENSMVFHMPTTGYESVVFSFAAKDEGAAEALVVDYSTVSGDPVWQTTGLSSQTFDLIEDYQLYTVDFSSITEADNNPYLRVRIRFDVLDGAVDIGDRVTFNNVALDGIPLAGTNLPPQLIEQIPFTEAIERQPLEVQLSNYFNDPDGDELSFTAESAVLSPEIVDLAVSEGVLTVSPEYRGETELTVSADDGHNSPVSTTFRILVYPEAHSLAESRFTFGYWDPDTPERTYPEHMLFLQSDQSDTAINTPLDYAYHLEPDEYHDDDIAAGTVGFPYNNTGRTRINGLNGDGISFINTGRDRDLGGALLALDTRKVNEAELEWLAGTVASNTRFYAIRLQYRIGIAGDFIDFTDAAGQPVEYVRSDLAGDVQNIPAVQLPADLIGREYIQLLWRYYRLSEDDDSGARAQLRLDDIALRNTLAPDGFNGWRFNQFSAEELTDPAVSGPQADPEGSGIENLLRYALGLERYDSYLNALPGFDMEGGVPVFTHRRLLDQDRDVQYVVVMVDDLTSVHSADEWPAAVVGEDVILLEIVPAGDGKTEILRYEIPSDSLNPKRFLRLKVIQQ